MGAKRRDSVDVVVAIVPRRCGETQLTRAGGWNEGKTKRENGVVGGQLLQVHSVDTILYCSCAAAPGTFTTAQLTHHSLISIPTLFISALLFSFPGET
jgi:hypothetical protein